MGDSSQAGASAQASGSTTQTNYGGMGMTALGGLTSAWASLQAGRMNRETAGFNARQATIQAEQAIQAGNAAALKREGQHRVVQGRVRSAMGAA